MFAWDFATKAQIKWGGGTQRPHLVCDVCTTSGVSPFLYRDPFF